MATLSSDDIPILGTSEAHGTTGSDDNKTAHEGDEEIAGMSLTTYKDDEDGGSDIAMSVEMLDPAIVMRGNVLTAPKFIYTRERLFEIKEFPLSKMRPKFLELPPNYGLVRTGNGQMERTHDRKRSDTPTDETPQAPENHPKRRSGDPRERIRKEQDGIVLSPQRRSFNLGCSAPLGVPAPIRRPESPVPKPDIMHRAELGTRRIGSGRIVTRDMPWDYKDESQDYNFRPGAPVRRDTEREIIPERFERRSFGRDYEKDNRRNGNRYSSDRRRQYSESKEDEPEWFSGGPTSQTDTIELRGFDDIPEERGRRAKPQLQKKKTEKNNNQVNGMQRKTSTSSLNESKENSPPKSGPGGRSTPKLDQTQMLEPDHSPVQTEDSKLELLNSTTDQGLFNKNIDADDGRKVDKDEKGEEPDILDDFLKMDSSWAGFYPNDEEPEDTGSKPVGGSRFQRWFNRSPIKPESRRSSFQDEEIIHNVLKDITETSIHIPLGGDSDTMFAPISPAAATMQSQNNIPPPSGPIGPPVDKTTTNLLEMLRGGNNKAKAEMPMKNLGEVSGKVLSLEEIEASVRRNDKAAQRSMHHSKTEEDMAQFKRLLAQVSSGPATNGQSKQPQQPMSLLQMLNKSQQDENVLRNSNQSQQHNMSMNHPPQIPPELVVKLHQVQQQQQRQEMMKILQAGMPNRPYQPSPSEMLNSGPSLSNLELLQRPEAQAIIQGLKRGDITIQHLRQQLANHAIQPRHREMILSVLKVHGGAGLPSTNPNTIHPSPRAVSPGGSHSELLQQFLVQQQQLRVSPLPPNAFCVSPILATSPNTLSIHHPVIPQRIPSPRELQQHTQNIMQQALIKKKLEEQREKYIKKQEQQSPDSSTGHMGASPAKHLSPTPHSFTPTSVLRKMTASKENESLLISKDKSNNNQMANEQALQKLQRENSLTQLTQQHGRAVTGMRQSSGLNSQSQMHMSGWSTQQQQQQQPSMSKQGRPILKGSGYQQQQQYNNVDFQGRQQQQQNIPGSLSAMFAQMQQQNQQQQQRSSMSQNNINLAALNSMGGSGGSAFMQSAGNNLRNNNMNNLSRQQHQQQQQQQQPHPSLQLHFQQLAQRGGVPPLQQLLQLHQGQGYNSESRGIPITGRSNLQYNNRASPLTDHHIPGDLSPTSDQLARWFSPKLLAQARAGQLPDMPPVSVAQSARSLEELERMQQATAPVHN